MSAIDTELKLVALESNDLYSLHQRQWQASHLNMPKDPEFINWACHLPLNDHEFSEILHSAVGPILTHPGTWQFQILSKEPPRTSNFGAIKQNAKAILIVRLEKGCGYIQHQFLTLAKSSYFQNHVQIMFVTPSYPLFEQLQTMSARLWSIYHTPFAIYWQNLQTIKPVLEHINQRCNTDYYAFIDEDVFAADAKWLKLLVESLDKRPDYGALGVKLLDFQNDVQHTGLGLQRSSAGRSIRPKYLTNIDPTNDILEREATSGACFMTRKQLFLKVDGFDEFPLQHFEDADYCFKIRELGYKVGVHQKAELHSFFERLTRYDDKRHMELAAYKHMKVWHKKLASGSLSRDLH